MMLQVKLGVRDIRAKMGKFYENAQHSSKAYAVPILSVPKK